jgi:hypothetical protein
MRSLRWSWTASWTEPPVQAVQLVSSAARLRGMRAASASEAPGRASHNPPVRAGRGTLNYRSPGSPRWSGAGCRNNSRQLICDVLTSGFRLRLARRRRSNEKVPLTWKNRTCLGTYQPRVEGTFPVKNSARTARVMVSADGRGLVSQAGAVLLWETMRVTGLGRGLSTGLDRWRAPRATSPPREELSRNSVHLDEAGPRPRGTSSQGRLNELTECQT